MACLRMGSCNGKTPLPAGVWHVDFAAQHTCAVHVGAATPRPGGGGKCLFPHALTAPVLGLALQALLAPDPSAPPIAMTRVLVDVREERAGRLQLREPGWLLPL